MYSMAICCMECDYYMYCDGTTRGCTSYKTALYLHEAAADSKSLKITVIMAASMIIQAEKAYKPTKPASLRRIAPAIGLPIKIPGQYMRRMVSDVVPNRSMSPVNRNMTEVGAVAGRMLAHAQAHGDTPSNQLTSQVCSVKDAVNDLKTRLSLWCTRSRSSIGLGYRNQKPIPLAYRLDQSCLRGS